MSWKEEGRSWRIRLQPESPKVFHSELWSDDLLSWSVRWSLDQHKNWQCRPSWVEPGGLERFIQLHFVFTGHPLLSSKMKNAFKRANQSYDYIKKRSVREHFVSKLCNNYLREKASLFDLFNIPVACRGRGCQESRVSDFAGELLQRPLLRQPPPQPTYPKGIKETQSKSKQLQRETHSLENL